MLSRSHRLSTRQFLGVIKESRPFHSPIFLIRIAVADDSSIIRIAAVMPVKIGKTAVIRNTVRRKIYAAVDQLVKEILKNEESKQSIKSVKSKVVKSLYVIVFAKSPALTATVPEMNADLRTLFVKARLLR